VLSPLLANILLDDLDKELERRGHRFVRYADDLLILVKSHRAVSMAINNGPLSANNIDPPERVKGNKMD